MNKTELANKILTIEGLSNEEKSDLLRLLREQKKYGLVWEDKPEDVEERLRSELPVLTEVKERAIISDDTNAPNHILIEGDNLEALTALSYTHEGKIDVIYIDPPYNTGHEDFMYNDNYIGEDNEYRHSMWLSFMCKRLQIAKRLLSGKGAIFISIDENEIATLRLLGDEIFHYSNFVGQWNWFKSATPPALSKKVKRTVEYVLCWKSPNNDEVFRGVQKVSKSNDPFTKPQNSYKILTFPANSITCVKDAGIIKAGIYGTDKFPNELLDDIIIVNGKNSNPVRFKNRFIWLQETLIENINQGLYIELSKNGVLSYKRSSYNREVPPNFIDNSVGVDTTENAGRLLLDIFDNNKVFDYPKPIALIQYLINFTDDKSLTVLDFFAGSGTTLHSVMQLNKEDGGTRKCILAQYPEPTYETVNGEKFARKNSKVAFNLGFEHITDITYERNKRVINGYTTPKGVEVTGLANNNLRYYRTDFIPREQTNANKRALVAAATDLLCIKNDIYTEQSEFFGRKLKPSAARYFDDGTTKMLVIYNEQTVNAFAEMIRNAEFEGKIKIYVFSNNRYAYNDNFEEVLNRVELCALPAAIYDAYAKVTRKKRATKIEEIAEEVASVEQTENAESIEAQSTFNFDEEGGNQ